MGTYCTRDIGLWNQRFQGNRVGQFPWLLQFLVTAQLVPKGWELFYFGWNGVLLGRRRSMATSSRTMDLNHYPEEKTHHSNSDPHVAVQTFMCRIYVPPMPTEKTISSPTNSYLVNNTPVDLRWLISPISWNTETEVSVAKIKLNVSAGEMHTFSYRCGLLKW